MPTDARKLVGYSDISESVLAEKSIWKEIVRQDVLVNADATSMKVYVNEAMTDQTYVPGTGVSLSQDGSTYVTVTNLEEKAMNELLDGFTAATAPADHVMQRFNAAIETRGEVLDTLVYAGMDAEGTLADGTLAATATTITNFIVGQTYKVTQANSAGDATTIGCAAATAVVGELFTALTDGTGLTALEAKQILLPTVSTIYEDILTLKLALDNEKAPKTGRKLIVTPTMENLMLDTDSKLVLDTNRGDRILSEGWIGRTAGFDIYSTTLLPAGLNMLAMQKRAYAAKDIYKIEPKIQDLNSSGTYIGDSAIQDRIAFLYGVIRANLIQLNKGS